LFNGLRKLAPLRPLPVVEAKPRESRNQFWEPVS
jgi:hypothetical protein